MEERSQAEPNVQSSGGQTLRSPQEGKLGQEAPEPADLASQGLPASQDPSKGLDTGLSWESAEPLPLLVLSLQGHAEEIPQGESGQSLQGYNGESVPGLGKGAPQNQRERKQSQQAQEFKTPQFGEDNNSEVWGKATIWRQEEGDPQGHSRDFCRFPGKPIPQCVETEIPAPPGSSTQLTQEGEWAPPCALVPPAQPLLRGPEGGIPAFGEQEPQTRLPGSIWEQRGSRDPKFSKAAWPGSGSTEEALARTEQEALQRLLELHGAAKERRRQDREHQRLRVRPRARPAGGGSDGRVAYAEPSSWPPPQVLERLRILGNHHRRVHPLVLPPRAAQMALQARTWGKVAGSPQWWGGQQPAASEGVQREGGGRWTVPCWLPQPAQSSCHLGGCGRMETHLARAAGTSAPRKDSVAAGTRGQVRGGQGMVGTTLL